MFEAAENSLPTRPNIILILADDMGFSDLGCFGSEIQTPNLNALAKGGVRFTSFYNTARCCPSRASLLTGLYPHQAGIGHMVAPLDHPSYQGYLRESTATIGEVLQKAGYLTGYSGKWHTGGNWPRHTRNPAERWSFGDPKRPLPTDRGFDLFYGVPTGAGSYFNASPLIDQDRLVSTPEGFYVTDNYTDAAIKMVDKALDKKKPFFIHLCHNAPHWPLHALPEDIEKYRGKYRKGWDVLRTSRHESLKGLGLLDPDWDISLRDEKSQPWEDSDKKDWEDARMAVYAAQIDRMDQSIGRLVQHLKNQNILDNTLIFFLSDNGGCAEALPIGGSWLKTGLKELTETLDGRTVKFGNDPTVDPGGPETYMSYDLPWASASNAPFRRFKTWVHEGGISTPLIGHWPKTIPAGTIQRSPCHNVDLYATIVDIAGAAYPKNRAGNNIPPMQGESFRAGLEGRSWNREQEIYWEHEGHRAVRRDIWKLVSVEGGEWELYNMEEDRTETKNLASSEIDRVRDMSRLYDSWAERSDVLPWKQVKDLYSRLHQRKR